MKDFREQMSVIGKEVQMTNGVSAAVTVSKAFNRAISDLFSTAREAAAIVNQYKTPDLIKILKIEDELVPLLFRFGDDCSGFVMITPVKYVFFISNNSGVIYTYGLERDMKRSKSIMTDSVQLLTINYRIVRSSVEYRDSTGSVLDPEEVVYHLFKWCMS